MFPVSLIPLHRAPTMLLMCCPPAISLSANLCGLARCFAMVCLRTSREALNSGVTVDRGTDPPEGNTVEHHITVENRPDEFGPVCNTWGGEVPLPPMRGVARKRRR